MKVLAVFGTRPEAIKMAPLVRILTDEPDIQVKTCVTGQHRDMLRPILNVFGVVPDWDLDVMVANQSLNGLMARIFNSIDPIFEAFKPDRVLVHGDTSSALASAIAAYHHRIPVGHVEAGLRTHDLSRPWPEEMNRRSIDAFADLLLAPTSVSRANLLAEGLANRNIVTTGNTVIDALMMTQKKLRDDPLFATNFSRRFPFCDALDRRILLVTGHRRENFGDGFLSICRALARLAGRDDIQIVYPVHLNPNVRGPVMRLLGGLDRVSLIEPLDYPDFVWMMDQAHVILTDSGGVQEEAPSIGKPVLVMRDVTERPEAVAAGTVRLVGTDEDVIVEEVARLFDDAAAYCNISRAINPYGDGQAAKRIVDTLMNRPVTEFTGDAC